MTDRMPVMLLSAALICAPAAAQPASVSGVVVDTDGKPVAGATVDLSRLFKVYNREFVRATTSDRQGRFVMQRLQPNDFYHLQAFHDGYLRGSAVNEKFLGLEGGENRTGIVLRIARAGEIRGRIVDSDGKVPLNA